MNDKILERIRALLALGASGNQHEAENAMNRLMMKHQISEAQLEASGAQAEEPLHANHAPIYAAGRKCAWKSALGTVLARAYHCRTVNWRLGRNLDEGAGPKLRASG